MKKRIITGATGFIGQALAKRWISQGNEVIAAGRSKSKINKIFGSSVEALTWDDIASSTGDILDDVSVVVNLAGAGVADKFWTEKRRKEILQSRIEATQFISNLCINSHNKQVVLFNASAIGIYGHQEQMPKGLPPALDEDAGVHQGGSQSYLAHVCREWEKATQPAAEKGIRVIHMRLGNVLGRNGGMLAKLFVPFNLGLGVVMGTGRQVISWISLDDLCSIFDFLINNPNISGPVNCVAPGAVTQKDFSKTLAGVLKKPCIFRAPVWILKALFGPMADELFLEGQHVRPQRLMDNGFVFKDTDLTEFLKSFYRND